MTTGPREWPGQPSRQRLELFLAASPHAVLALLDERDDLEGQLHSQTGKPTLPRCLFCVATE
jgi:hypothetical protein